MNKQSKLSLTPKVKAIIVDIVCYSFLILFVYTAVNKLWKLESFIFVLGKMPLIGNNMSSFIGYFIPSVEIIISILLMIPIGSFGKTDPSIPQLNCRSIPLQIDPLISDQTDPFCLSSPFFQSGRINLSLSFKAK